MAMSWKDLVATRGAWRARQGRYALEDARRGAGVTSRLAPRQRGAGTASSAATKWVQKLTAGAQPLGKGVYGDYAPEEIDVSDPRAQILEAFGADSDEWMNPMGSARLGTAMRQQGFAEEGAQKRAAITGLRARGGAPGGYGVAALLSGLNAQSSLSGSLRGAQADTANRNQSFLAQLSGGLVGYQQEQRARREEYEREKYMENLRQKHERWLAKKAKPNSVGIGPVSFSW